MVARETAKKKIMPLIPRCQFSSIDLATLFPRRKHPMAFLGVLPGKTGEELLGDDLEQSDCGHYSLD